MKATMLVWLVGPAVALSLACADLVPQPRSVPPLERQHVYVSKPPPVPRVEVVDAPPDDEAVWIGGYYDWLGTNWSWKPGRWAHVPPGLSRTRWDWDYDAEGRVRYWPPRWVNEDGQLVDDAVIPSASAPAS